MSARTIEDSAIHPEFIRFFLANVLTLLIIHKYTYTRIIICMAQTTLVYGQLLGNSDGVSTQSTPCIYHIDIHMDVYICTKYDWENKCMC